MREFFPVLERTDALMGPNSWRWVWDLPVASEGVPMDHAVAQRFSIRIETASV